MTIIRLLRQIAILALTFLPATISIAGDLGLTKEQAKAKYGEPKIRMAMGKYNGKEKTNYLYIVKTFPAVSATLSMVEGIVVETEYESSSESALSGEDVARFLEVCGIDPSWPVVVNESRGETYGVRMKRADGSLGYIVRSAHKMTAKFELGVWLEVTAQYKAEQSKLPWYKKAF